MQGVSTLGKRKATKIDIPEPEEDPDECYILTSHDQPFGSDPIPLNWGEKDPNVRGPIIATTRHRGQRNAIGAHSGSYCIYRGLAVAAGGLDTTYKPQLNMTTPVAKIGPFPSWFDPKKIASIDPFGHLTLEAFGDYVEKGYDIRPTIAVTKATIELAELAQAIEAGRIIPDGRVCSAGGQCNVTKAAIEPAWYLPVIAERFKVTESHLRACIYRETNMMYPELITRPDIKMFLPPIGGMTCYIFGDPLKIHDEKVPLTVRVHDECNGSDVFGSDICTCRPYLIHAMEECIKTAVAGGTGIVIYYRKEGRALGEVTKYLVYNMRKRQEGGDRADEYFNCTQHVAGVQDTRFQALMPDPLHWLGVTKIHRFISMSDMKYDAIVGSGIKIEERVPIPEELVPQDAKVEITAKVFAGYNGGNTYSVDEAKLHDTVGREFFSDDTNQTNKKQKTSPKKAPLSPNKKK